MPAWLLHGLARDLADELLLGGQRVLPDKAEASGFRFRHATLDSALAAMLGARKRVIYPQVELRLTNRLVSSPPEQPVEQPAVHAGLLPRR
jgi:hypothetical protein